MYIGLLICALLWVSATLFLPWELLYLLHVSIFMTSQLLWFFLNLSFQSIRLLLSHQFHLNSFSINLSFQEVDELWSRFREMKYYIPCPLMDPLQWMGAVRMRVQAADKSMTIIHNTILDDKSMFCKVKSCIFVIKKLHHDVLTLNCPLSIILLSPVKKLSFLNQERNMCRLTTVHEQNQSKAFTAEDPLMSKYCNLSKFVPVKKQTPLHVEWPEDKYIFILEWNI